MVHIIERASEHQHWPGLSPPHPHRSWWITPSCVGGRNFMAHIFVPDTRGTNNLYYNIIEIGVRARFRELFAITWTWIRQFFQVNNI